MWLIIKRTLLLNMTIWHWQGSTNAEDSFPFTSKITLKHWFPVTSNHAKMIFTFFSLFSAFFTKPTFEERGFDCIVAEEHHHLFYVIPSWLMKRLFVTKKKQFRQELIKNSENKKWITKALLVRVLRKKWIIPLQSFRISLKNAKNFFTFAFLNHQINSSIPNCPFSSLLRKSRLWLLKITKFKLKEGKKVFLFLPLVSISSLI